MTADRYGKTRESGPLLVDHLGLDEVSVPRLLDLARITLGENRAGRCVELCRRLPLTQRYRGLSAIAALIAGSQHLGVEWWDRPHRAPVNRSPGELGPTPEARLTREVATDDRSPSTLVELGWWIADDVAVDLWGPLVDEVDLNDPQAVDRVRLPGDAIAGQEMTAHFDVGGVVDVVVEEREGGTLGSRLGATRYAVPADVDWAWGVSCTPPGPFPLPGDEPDPYAVAVDADVSGELRRDADRLGWNLNQLGGVWKTRADLCAVLARLDWPWLDGEPKSTDWRKRMEALIDKGPDG